MKWCYSSPIIYFRKKSIKHIYNVDFWKILIIWITQMTSYESLHIFKLIKISILYNVLTLWNFFLQFSTFFKMNQYQLFPVISMHVEKQCNSPLRVDPYCVRRQNSKLLLLQVAMKLFISRILQWQINYTLSSKYPPPPSFHEMQHPWGIK